MNMRYYLGILFLLTASCTVSLGQTRTINLEEARELAIQNNKTLKMASEQERVAYYEKKDAFTKYFPEISMMGGYIRNQKNLNLIPSSSIPSSITLPPISGVFPGAEIPVPDGIRDRIKKIGEVDIKNIWIGNISLVQPLFMGGKIVAYNDIMKNAELLAKNQKDTKLQDVIVEVDATYWQVISLSYKKKLAESYLGLLKKMYSDVNAMEEEGVATKADVLSVAVKENEAEMALTKVDNGLSLSRMLLNQICGLPIDDSITLFDEVNEVKLADNGTVEIPSVQEAWYNRSEIKSLELATKIYKGKEKVARAEFMPQVALTANYLWTSPNMFDGFDKSFRGMWNVGVLVKVPLNIASNTAKLNAAKAQTRIQEYQLEEAKEKIELQVNQSAYKLNEAYKRYTASEKNMEKSNENLRYANTGFEEGVIPPSDVLAAHTAWLSAHSDLIDAQIDIRLSRVYLDKALGRNLK